MVAVVNAGLPSGPRLPLHQSHAALPGLIHEVSAIADSGLRLLTILDSMSFAGLSAIWITRQGEWWGRVPVTATPGSSRCGASLDTGVGSPQALPVLVRDMAALSLRSASVTANQATPGSSPTSGSPAIRGSEPPPWLARLLAVLLTNSLSYWDVKLGRNRV